MDIDYFIRKFDAIPDDKWCVRAFVEGNKRCALGHCGASDGSPFVGEAEFLIHVIRTSILGLWWCTSEINDGAEQCRELGDTPRERILNALCLAKAIEEHGI